jgi:hypothetical protein
MPRLVINNPKDSMRLRNKARPIFDGRFELASSMADRVEAFFAQPLAGGSRIFPAFSLSGLAFTTSAKAPVASRRWPRPAPPRVSNLAADPVASFAIEFPQVRANLCADFAGKKNATEFANDVVHRLKQHSPPIRGFISARKVTPRRDEPDRHGIGCFTNRSRCARFTSGLWIVNAIRFGRRTLTTFAN